MWNEEIPRRTKAFGLPRRVILFLPLSIRRFVLHFVLPFHWNWEIAYASLLFREKEMGDCDSLRLEPVV